ncbi:hypothetical protein KPH14_012052 [Odynerus spinipes]|uniref:Uncharacterized protein n=1 Tax=Odynerus spinipes TaxID=1348599 RepID=A0AAD9RVM4_9HYME|nr:hypothetical protein KPH14_012052 [Odynerus spinipes]
MEIVIENPTESQTAPANATVAAAAAAAVSAMSETTATTTTMAMTSETSVTVQPTTTTTPPANSAHPPFHRSPHCTPILYGSQSPIAMPDQEYYLPQRSPRPLSSIDDFDEVAGTSMRRVDRSGLLEMSSLEPSPTSSSSSSSRYRHCRPIGAESSNIAGHAGTLPRRVDRSGLLEALPELPENRRGPEDVLRSTYGGGVVNRHSTVIAEMAEREQEAAMMKPDVVALVRSPTYDSSTTRFSSPSPSSSLASGLLRPPESPSPVSTTSRMSPTANLTRRADGDSIPSERTVRFRPTDTFLPSQHVESSLGLPGRSSYVDSTTNFGTSMEKNDADGERSYSPEKKEEKKNETSCEVSNDKSTETENCGEEEKEENEVPRGERAEAEGCENTQANENLEEGRVSYSASNNKLYHNDNVQTLTVIILSEQL